MTQQRKMLLESLAGHLALLQNAYPRKANTLVAKRARQCVKLALRTDDRRRMAA